MPLCQEIFTVNQFLYDTEIISWDQRASAELRGKSYRCRFYLPALMPGINGLIHQTFNCLGRDLCYRYQPSECMYMALIKYSASLNTLRRQKSASMSRSKPYFLIFRNQILLISLPEKKERKKKKNHTWNHCTGSHFWNMFFPVCVPGLHQILSTWKSVTLQCA